MTLIMNNLAMSVSIFALIFSIFVMFLQYKTEVIDRKQRQAKYANMRRLFEEGSIYYKDYTNK